MDHQYPRAVIMASEIPPCTMSWLGPPAGNCPFASITIVIFLFLSAHT